VNDAVYVGGATPKIFGTVGPYVCKYDATTGAREGFVRVGAPLYGEMRICYHTATDSLYVATWNEPNEQYTGFYAAGFWPTRDVFPVSLALAIGSPLGLGGLTGGFAQSTEPPYKGFRWIASSGSYLYISVSGVGFTIERINPAVLADRNASGSPNGGFAVEQCGLSPTQIVSPLRLSSQQIQYGTILFNAPGDMTSRSVAPRQPVACEYCASNGLFYLVCGDTNLVRINTLAPINITTLNLGAVEATADPCRIRYRTSDGKLYLPCMSSETVIVWDPSTETGIAKTGFSNPVDVIFAGSKAWAVQNSPIGLKEIL
jgi:hypothetical protein